MKRLCTKEASRKTMHYILLLAWLVYIPYVFLQYGLNQAFLINLGFASLLLGISEVVVFCIWYPKERLHKKAIEQGEVYEGKITRIMPKLSKKKLRSDPVFVYSMMISCTINGEMRVWEDGDYVDDPSKYIPSDRRCKVYFYKNKCYPQYFYLNDNSVSGEPFFQYSIQDIEYLNKEELLQASSERMSKAGMYGNAHIIVPTILFVYSKRPPMKNLFIDVRVKAKKNYDDIAFLLHDSINESLRGAELVETPGDEMLKDKVKNMIKDLIANRDEDIVVEEIFVVIR